MKMPKEVAARALTFYNRHYKEWLLGQFSPLAVGLVPPTVRDVLVDEGFGVQQWLKAWSEFKSKHPQIRIDHVNKRIGHLGIYAVPHTLWIDSVDVAVQIAGWHKEWSRALHLLDTMTTSLESMTGSKTREILAAKATAWQGWDDITAQQFIDVVTWLCQHDTRARYIRELPVYGVDTKWIERHRGLVQALTGPLIFKEKPLLLEIRSLDQEVNFGGSKHLAIPLDDAVPYPDSQSMCGGSSSLVNLVELLALGYLLLIVENHMTFLALPRLSRVVAIYGAGDRAVSVARALEKAGITASGTDDKIMYWGDADSHGYEALDEVRGFLPSVESVFMDLETVRKYRDLAVEEPLSSRFLPTHLRDDEIAALDYLRENSVSGCLRIEQERLPFHHVLEALRGKIP